MARRRGRSGALVAVGLLVAACDGGTPTSTAPDPDVMAATTSATTSATASAPTTTPSTAAHDPGWVSTENAAEGARRWTVPQEQRAGEMELAGYADAESVLPGEPVGLHVTSAGEPWRVRALRLGHYEGREAREVWSSAEQEGTTQPGPVLAEDGVAPLGWDRSLEVDTTGWPEGAYLLRLEGLDSGRAAFVPLTLRSSSTEGRLVLLTATTTYQAYNAWGGASSYLGPDDTFGSRATRLTLDRPYDRDGARIPLQYELGPIALAESLGLDLAYLSSRDLDSEPGILDGARGLVSLGHDEYWTVPMRRAVEEARDEGMNLAFLGANAVYWRARYEDDGRTLVVTKDAAADPGAGEETTDLWRRGPGASPENALVGMLYECFPAQGPLVVHDPDFFLLEGTGARAGSSYPGLVGTEVDRAYPIPGTPETLRVVAHSPVRCGDVGPTHADMTYYWNDAGAGVFAVGTMAWAKAVRRPVPALGIDEAAHEFARAVTATLFERMAAGPMADQADARPDGNLSELGLSTSTSTGTGMPYAVDP